MATELTKPVVRELNANKIGDLLGITASRPLVITMNVHGISFKAKGRHGEGLLIGWEKIIGYTAGGMGLTAMKRELR